MESDQQDKISKKLKYMFYVLAFIFSVLLTTSTYMMIIASFVDFGSCWMRYNTDKDGILTTDATVTTKAIKLKATMNYDTVFDPISNPAQPRFIPDPTSYGKWYDAGELPDPEKFELQVEGSVSLCASYVQDHNLQQETVPGIRPKIPKVGESEYLSLRFPANSDGWKNLIEVTTNDQVRILVKEPLDAMNTTNIASVTMKDAITNADTNPANCSRDVTTDVSPMCGRVSLYKGSFVNTCQSYTVPVCPRTYYCTAWGQCDVGLRDGRCHITESSCPCTHVSDPWYDTSYIPVSTPMPTIYSQNHDNIFFYRTDEERKSAVPARKAGDYFQNFSMNCNDAIQRDALPARVAGYKFWLTHGEGMRYRYWNDQRGPVNFIPSDTTVTTQGKLQHPDGNYAPGYVIFNDIVLPENVPSTGTSMLQMGYINSGNPADNTGGYVIHVQHTKCRRTNGEYKSDSFVGRGKILYYILPAEYDMNALPQDAGFRLADFQNGFLELRPDSNKVTIDVNAEQLLKSGQQKLWLKILNKPEDYKDSEGEYDVKFNSKKTVGIFTGKVLIPIFHKVDTIIESAGQIFFKNMTCYGKSSGKCTDFFLYIKALLTLYVAVLGMSFLLGRLQMSQYEFIIHVVKILIIAGLMNGSTFEFFEHNVFGALMNFTNEIMANFGGYSNENPFTFLDQALNRILLNKMTAFQMLALISGGLTGVFMFFMTFIGIYVFLLSAIQGIATYIFAKLVLAFLFGIAPLFLTFMLFAPTRKFFQSWVNNVFRYTIEPVVVLLGLAVFTNLFILYLDNALGYSVCFKCAIPIKVPNILSYLMPGFPNAFKDVYLICLYWFGPWGIDSNLGIIALNIPDIVGLSLIAFMNYTYVQFSASLVTNLTSAMGASAASMGGAAGTEAFTNVQSVASAVFRGGKSAGQSAYKRGMGEGREKFDASKSAKSAGATAKDAASAGAAGKDGAGDQVMSKLDTSMKPMAQLSEAVTGAKTDAVGAKTDAASKVADASGDPLGKTTTSTTAPSEDPTNPSEDPSSPSEDPTNPSESPKSGTPRSGSGTTKPGSSSPTAAGENPTSPSVDGDPTPPSGPNLGDIGGVE